MYIRSKGNLQIDNHSLQQLKSILKFIQVYFYLQWYLNKKNHVKCKRCPTLKVFLVLTFVIFLNAANFKTNSNRKNVNLY